MAHRTPLSPPVAAAVGACVARTGAPRPHVEDAAKSMREALGASDAQVAEVLEFLRLGPTERPRPIPVPAR